MTADTRAWVLWSPCGCPRGVTEARYAPDEANAWAVFHLRARAQQEARERGERLELVTRRQYLTEIAPTMGQPCPHVAVAQ